MQSILIVSSSEKTSAFFNEVFPSYYSHELTTARSCGEARRILVERSFDLCVINAPLQDESGERFAVNIIGEKVNQVILIVREEMVDEITAKVEDFGVFTIGKPLLKSTFYMAYKMADMAYKRLNRIKSENDKLKRQLSDMKLVSKAKCILVEREGITEEEAHKIIESTAMNDRKTRGDVASEIIRKYS